MKKQIYLCVLWVVTILIIILIATNKMTGIHFHVTDGNWDVSTKSDRNYDSKYADKIDETLQKFENIDVNSNVMELTVKPGREFHIYSTYNNQRYMPEFDVKNGTLHVRQNFPKSHTGNINCKVEITIPENTVLDNIDIKNNVGEINLKNFEAKEIKAETNVGEISVDSLDFNNLKLENNVGEISIHTLESSDKYNIVAKTDVGDVSVDGRSHKRRYEQNNGSRKNIKAVANVGEVSIN